VLEVAPHGGRAPRRAAVGRPRFISNGLARHLRCCLLHCTLWVCNLTDVA
jgi:hypothetical protein